MATVWSSTVLLLGLAIAESFGLANFWDVKTVWLLEDITFSLAMITSVPIIGKNLTPVNRKISKAASMLNRKPAIEIEIKDADKIFAKEKEKEITKAEEKIDQIRLDTEECLEELDSVLEEMEEHSDYKDRQVIEDVMSNIAFRRRKMIDRLELAEEAEELNQDLDDFVKEFQNMSQKEEAVIEEAVIPDEFHDKLRDLDECRNRIDLFLKYDYKALENQEKLEKAVSQYKEKLKELRKIEDRKELLDIESEEELEEIKSEIQELKNGQKWKEYQRLNDRIDELKSEKIELEKEVGSASQKMQRGMKKLIYEIENGELSTDSNIELLKKIRDGRKDNILNNTEKVEEAAKEAEEILPENLLDERQAEKFSKGASMLKDISQIKDKIEDTQEEIRELEQKKDESEVLDQKKKLEEQKKELEEKISQEESEQEEIEEKIESKETKVRKLEDKIKDILNSELNREVEFDSR